LDSVYSRIENLRIFLERELGLSLFLTVYRHLLALSELDDDDASDVALTKLVAPDKTDLLNVVCQLICCEDRVYDQHRQS